MHLFTYGSLMFPQVWTVVVRGDYPPHPARLHGHQRRRIQGETYPAAIAASTTDFIDGQLYLNISPDDMQRLDHFEGDDYAKIEVPVTLSDNRVVTAAVYLYRHPERLATQDWDVAWFEREGIHAFLAQYGGFER